MILSDIVKTNDWPEVENILLKIYPDKIEDSKAYQNVFQHLQEMEAEEDTIEIVIQSAREDDAEDSSFIDVYGIDRKSKEEASEPLALEYVRWEKWLGMTIQQQTITEFTEPEIIAHCLYEMTWAGFDQKEIQKKLSEIRREEK